MDYGTTSPSIASASNSSCSTGCRSPREIAPDIGVLLVVDFLLGRSTRPTASASFVDFTGGGATTVRAGAGGPSQPVPSLHRDRGESFSLTSRRKSTARPARQSLQ